ncbi:MAG: BON domain-containing protein, partial [Deltaproteobacteria bacterium]|nr:BON domain-containing protein [Deltaproteobacteria bacterium]
MDPADPFAAHLGQWQADFSPSLHGEVRNGLLWLHGTVADHRQRQALAAAVTETLPEEVVVNAVTVALDEAVADAVILRYLHAALSNAPGVSVETLAVEVGDGVVSLVGEVGSAAELAQAVDLAASVRGVRRVTCLLALAPDAQRRDLRIVEQVMERLCFTPGIDDRLIRVMATEGEVVLFGR